MRFQQTLSHYDLGRYLAAQKSFKETVVFIILIGLLNTILLFWEDLLVMKSVLAEEETGDYHSSGAFSALISTREIRIITAYLSIILVFLRIHRAVFQNGKYLLANFRCPPRNTEADCSHRHWLIGTKMILHPICRDQSHLTLCCRRCNKRLYEGFIYAKNINPYLKIPVTRKIF